VIGSAFPLLLLVYTAMAHTFAEQPANKTPEMLKKEADELEAIAEQQARINAVKSALSANTIGSTFDRLGLLKEGAKGLLHGQQNDHQLRTSTDQSSDQSSDQSRAQIEQQNERQRDQSIAQSERREVITEPINQIEEQEPVELIELVQTAHQPHLPLITSGLDPLKLAKVRKVLKNEPDISDRQLAQKTEMAAATAKRYRAQLSSSKVRNRA
jgi:hypothetical protein